jgi:uracil-DNA glycosylase
MTEPNIHPEWKELLKEEFRSDYFAKLKAFLEEERGHSKLYPPGKLIFAAFDQTPPKNIKVLLLGQDPYHGDGQANGFCFSVNDGVKMPPSLQNIFKELRSDMGCEIPLSGNLERWAQQGVFLLNATLTVRQNTAGSHQNKGWEMFTDAVIKHVSDSRENIVFMLWGNYAKAKAPLIDASKHLILQAAHPSPLARGAFFGSKHFSQANDYLKSKGQKEIDWCL